MPPCPTAVADIEKRLECLVASDGTPIQLVQFHHQSPGLAALRHKIADAIVSAIEERHTVDLKS